MFKYLRQTFRKENNELVNRYKDYYYYCIKCKNKSLTVKTKGKGKR